MGIGHLLDFGNAVKELGVRKHAVADKDKKGS